VTRAKTTGKPAVTATRLCATCGDPFTWSSANPRKRFCTPICKARWWRLSHDETPITTPPTARATSGGRAPAKAASTANATQVRTANAVTAQYAPASRRTTDPHDAAAVSGEVRTANAVTAEYGTCDTPYGSGYGGASGQPPGAIQHCPNCHQPVAVINMLVPPAAAFVNTPSQSVTDTQINRNLISL
jgi:endogenous inhibitor of DNA gyrase (YacG/DUF329 family)